MHWLVGGVLRSGKRVHKTIAIGIVLATQSADDVSVQEQLLICILEQMLLPAILLSA